MVLLDTHVLIWMNTDSSSLSRKAREAIRQARAKGSIAISDISVWEMAWLAQRKRIAVFGTLEAFLQSAVAEIVIHPVTPEIAALGAGFPSTFPRDLADRLIASTALSHGIPLLTADERIRDSHVVPTIW